MKYLVSIHRPTDYDHAMLDATARQAIDQVNDDMVTAGVRVFVGGLCSPSTATSLRLQPDGEVTISSGPILNTNEYVDGFWVLDCSNLDQALEWGQRAALACRGPVEVRPFAG
ncbi:MAG: YciI family protein [Fimbriimonadaceae bacterium]